MTTRWLPGLSAAGRARGWQHYRRRLHSRPLVANSLTPRLSDHWLITEDSVLGSGNFGVVYRAESAPGSAESSTGPKVAALKAIDKNLPTFSLRATTDEVRALKTVSHNSAIDLWGVLEDRDYIYIITPLYEGCDLLSCIRERSMYSEVDASTIVRQVLDVLAYCHSRGVIHRDIKPENLILRRPSSFKGSHFEELELVVIDFGTATSFRPGSPLMARCGTLHYMAPECISRSGYGPAADLWSVGVLLYVLLSGKMPFAGNSAEEIRRRVCDRDWSWEQPSKWKQVSAAAKDLVSQLLDADPTKRPTAAQALRHEWIVAAATDTQTPAATACDPLPPSVIDGIARFAEMQVVERAAMQVLLPLVSTDRVDEVRATFHALDVDGNGTLSMAEFFNGMKHLAPDRFANPSHTRARQRSQLESLFNAIDMTEDGSIDIDEWITAALNSHAFSLRHAAHLAFERLDVNLDGVVDGKELAAALVAASNAADDGGLGPPLTLRQLSQDVPLESQVSEADMHEILRARLQIK